MNTEQNNQPTDEQINKRLAEWMGWEIRYDGTQPLFKWELRSPNGQLRYATDLNRSSISYTTSHDAIAEVLERMTGEQFEQYAIWLDNIVDPKARQDECPCMDCLKATAHQKALAIYRVLEGEK